MSGIDPIASVTLAPPALTSLGTAFPMEPVAAPGVSFANVLMNGMQGMQAKLDSADALVRKVALGETVPIHQVTYALEEARLSVELAMQVRGRLLDGYRELMNLQL